MLASRPYLLGLALLLCGCLKSEAFFDDDIPVDIEHVGVAVLSEKGVVRRISPLHTPRDTPPILREAGDRVWYFGWTSALLEAEVDLDLLRGEPLIARPDCRPGLPEPTWSVTVESGAEQIARPRAPILALSHPSLLGSCPTENLVRPESEKPTELYSNVSVRNSCLGSICQVEIQVRDECRVDIDLGRCVGQAQSGFVDRHGRICVDESFGCEQRPTAADALISFACQVGPNECRFSVYQPEEALPISFEKVRVAPPLAAQLVSTLPQRVPLFASHSGHVPDLAVGSERVSALVRSDVTLQPDCSDEATPAALVELGGSPLQVTSRAEPSLPCLRVLAMDHEDRLFGVYGVYPELHFAAFDASGAVQATRRIPDSAPLETGAYVPVDLAYDPESETLALALHTESFAGEDRLVFASRDLRTVQTSTLTRLRISSLRTGRNREDEPRLVLAEPTQSLAVWWKPWAFMEESGAGLVSAGIRQTLLSAAPFGEGWVIGLFGDETPAMTLSRYGSIGAFDVFWFFEGVADGTLLVEQGSEEQENHRVLIAGRERGAGALGTAWIGQFRSQPARIQAGSRVLGEGIVTGGHRDAAGNAWLALPWSGEVLRIDAPPPAP